jgi:dTDP-glucose pyrophosphorylase
MTKKMSKTISTMDVLLLGGVSISAIVVAVLDSLNVFGTIAFFSELNISLITLVLLSIIGLHVAVTSARQSDFELKLPEIIRGVAGVSVQVFADAAELDKYRSERIPEAKKEVCDLTWKEKLSSGYSVKKRVESHKLYENSIDKASDSIIYREIFIFTDLRRIQKMSQRLKARKSGYSCRYFSATQDIPRLQFVLIDREETIFTSTTNTTLCAIKHKGVGEVLYSYFNEVWERAIPIKDGTIIHYDELDKIDKIFPGNVPLREGLGKPAERTPGEMKQVERPSARAPSVAILLAAGRGNRLKPYTDAAPKPLLTYGGRAALDYVFAALEKAQIQKVIIVTNYLEQQLTRYVTEKYAQRFAVTFCHQEQLLGSANAVSSARKVAMQYVAQNKPLLISATDYVMPEDYLLDLVRFHESHNADISVSLRKMPSTQADRSSQISENSNGDLVRIYEKLEEDSLNRPIVAASLIYIVPPTIFDFADAAARSVRGEYELPDVINMMIDRGLRARGYLQPEMLDLDQALKPETAGKV